MSHEKLSSVALSCGASRHLCAIVCFADWGSFASRPSRIRDVEPNGSALLAFLKVQVISKQINKLQIALRIHQRHRNKAQDDKRLWEHPILANRLNSKLSIEISTT